MTAVVEPVLLCGAGQDAQTEPQCLHEYFNAE